MSNHSNAGAAPNTTSVSHPSASTATGALLSRPVDRRCQLNRKIARSGIELWCTLGPASMSERVIRRLDRLGVHLFRVNLSHTRLDDLPGIIDFVRRHSDVPICLDTEGAQIRTGRFADGAVTFEDGDFVTVDGRDIEGNAQNFSLYPGYIIDDLAIGDLISIDFNAVLAQVAKKIPGRVVLQILNSGSVGQNKAVSLHRRIGLRPFTDKDQAAVKIGRQMGISHFALSFANRPSDVDELRVATGKSCTIISKIECRAGVANLEAIAEKSDAILIDRGDLSREVSIERIPRLQKEIIRRTKLTGTRVIVATNLLESMTIEPVPTRAEINDIYNTLEDGADGLVLAAETAIGKHPIGCANMVARMIREFDGAADKIGAVPAASADVMLIEPHGGVLVNRVLDDIGPAYIDGLKRLRADEEALTDAEHIATGTYSPLEGFMDGETLDSVFAHHRLPTGIVWPVPVILPVTENSAAGISAGERIVLTDRAGRPHSVIEVSGIHVLDRHAMADAWLGTTSPDYHGIKDFRQRGTHFIGGKVSLLPNASSSFHRHALTPAESRFVFSQKGWSDVVGFFGGSMADRRHEHVQLAALEHSDADGLYLAPVMGAQAPGDVRGDLVMRGYQALLQSGAYPSGRTVLGSFANYRRYRGAREVLFLALCAKNIGCSHFIVSTGESEGGDGFGLGDIRNLADRLDDLGIEMLFFDEIGYNSKLDIYTGKTPGRNVEAIDVKVIKAAFADSQTLPEWMIRSVVQDVIRDEKASLRPIFLT